MNTFRRGLARGEQPPHEVRVLNNSSRVSDIEDSAPSQKLALSITKTWGLGLFGSNLDFHFQQGLQQEHQGLEHSILTVQIPHRKGYSETMRSTTATSIIYCDRAIHWTGSWLTPSARCSTDAETRENCRYQWTNRTNIRMSHTRPVSSAIILHFMT